MVETSGDLVRVLVTNDDGIGAPGLAALITALQRRSERSGALGGDQDEATELLVVAPASEHSGAGTAVGPLGRLRHDGAELTAVSLPGLRAVPCFALEGPPGLAVLAAYSGAFGPIPDAVVAGVNPGRNLGRLVTHSGTVGAVLTAVNLGGRGVAISCQPAGPDTPFELAAELASELLTPLCSWPSPIALNCNVPWQAGRDLRGVRSAPLATTTAVRRVVPLVVGPTSEQTASSPDRIPVSVDGASRLRLEMHYRQHNALSDDTMSDEALSASGYVTITALRGIGEDLATKAGSDALTRVTEALTNRLTSYAQSHAN